MGHLVVATGIGMNPIRIITGGEDALHVDHGDPRAFGRYNVSNCCIIGPKDRAGAMPERDNLRHDDVCLRQTFENIVEKC